MHEAHSSDGGGGGGGNAHTYLTTVFQAAKKYGLPVTKLIGILPVQIHFSFGYVFIFDFISYLCLALLGFEWWFKF